MEVEKKITLRGLEFKDEKLIFDWKSDNQLRELLGTVYPISELEHHKWFENKMLEQSNKHFIIEYKNNAIGMVGFDNVDWINRNAEIFIFIGDKNLWGKGIGSKAITELEYIAFGKMNLHMIYLHVFSFNSRAINAYKKMGFHVDGILRESKFLKGKYYDSILMSKIFRMNEG
ncbi:GNAT family N-acetyltransferase [Staphylococcus simulans]|uniref:GNAT family N-acetyltransferase n=3 Tax=Staphylococcus simulans TaxID=1286 RepID=UPI000D1F449F|nr:GNAT family protein [Staphylococcus simulans]PTI92882.1 GNAT family N-acetyltransferase [Staphylococcus simulans]PTJ02685.1 GNAT family N-acetyltransferase [Staphylococcus simulans]PTJ38605.1 GNAT family N-acetyltransferase [Staphylococcus simulans]